MKLNEAIASDESLGDLPLHCHSYCRMTRDVTDEKLSAIADYELLVPMPPEAAGSTSPKVDEVGKRRSIQ